MARQGVTFDKVAATAEALASEGQQPTIKAVRERLGGTGSPNTIHKHLTTWREGKPSSGQVLELPGGLAAAITAELGRAAANARAEVEDKLAEALAEAAALAEAGDALERERDEMAEQVAALTTERDTLIGRLQQQAEELDRLRVELAEAQQGRADAREQAARLAGRLEVLEGRSKPDSNRDKSRNGQGA